MMKKYSKSEEIFNTKEYFQCFYMSIILFDLVYRKNGKLKKIKFLLHLRSKGCWDVIIKIYSIYLYHHFENLSQEKYDVFINLNIKKNFNIQKEFS